MRDEDIHIGDRFRIRQWEDMELEFGLTTVGDINCVYCFAKSMRYLCGRPFTIKAKEVGYLSEEGEEVDRSAPGGRWKISADMLEPVDDPVEIIPFTDDEINLLLGVEVGK